jgi:hypothetical protein
MRSLAFVAMIFFCVCRAALALPTIQLNTADCHKSNFAFSRDVQKLLGKNWLHYQPYMNICLVRTSSGSVALSILALSMPEADQANDLLWLNGKRWNSQSDGFPYDAIPLPIILDDNNRPIGTLPEQVFLEVPQSSEVRFSDWLNNFPQRISLYIVDPTESAPHSPYCPPPLVWNPEQHRYIQMKGDDYGACAK